MSLPSNENKKKVNARYNLRPFNEAPSEIAGDYDFIEIPAIDLSEYEYGPRGLKSRQKLAEELEKSVTGYGFFNLVGYGITEEELSNMKSIGQSIFELSEEEKDKFLAGTKNFYQEKERDLGVIRGNGFKPKGYWTYADKTQDNVEFFNVRHFLHDDIFFNLLEYPEFVRNNLEEISAYFKYLQYHVLRKLLTLFDIILDIPEGTLWEKYFKVIEGDIVNSGGGFGRFIFYHEVDNKYDESTKGTWLRGHTDATALTFIISQPILSLQIKDYKTGRWRYIRHNPNALIVNIGDAFQQLTGGYFRSSIHRVVTPPKEQRKYKRNTVIYFCDPSLTTYVDPESLQSPKLSRLNIISPPNAQKITFSEWDEAKGKFFNTKDGATRNQLLNFFGRDSIGSLIDNEGA